MNHTTRKLDSETLARARSLRQPQTPAEAKLWRRLRANQIAGVKFRRQHPVGPFVVDFYCASAKLLIEIDGDSHYREGHSEKSRTAFLQQRGYRVIRFTNTDVHTNIEGVLEAIAEACGMK